MEQLSEPWSTAAEKAGVRQTYRGIAERAGISHVTVRRLVVEGRTSQATVTKVADALGVDEATIYGWAGVDLSEWGPWIPPREAHKLNPRARAALEELIRAITQGGSSELATTSQKIEQGLGVEDEARQYGDDLPLRLVPDPPAPTGDPGSRRRQ